jgi:MerR family transcriptional regulator, copper efflux regulator
MTARSSAGATEEFVRRCRRVQVCGGYALSASLRLTLEPVPSFIIRAVTKNGAKNDPATVMLRAGELARLTGVSADTLRHYERKGLLKPRRAPNGYREYSPQAVERVRLIRSALAIGFKLDELTRLLKTRDAGGAPCQRVRTLAAAKLAELETLVSEITARRDGLREVLEGWDSRLAAAAGEPARLLEMLANTGFANDHPSAQLKTLRLKYQPKQKEKR